MQAYKITYAGNDTKFKNRDIEIEATNSHSALIEFYKNNFADNYFPDYTSFGEIIGIYDADGNLVYTPVYNSIWHHGGYFEAELITGE